MCNISKQINKSEFFNFYYKWIDGDLFFKRKLDAAQEALIDDLEIRGILSNI